MSELGTELLDFVFFYLDEPVRFKLLGKSEATVVRLSRKSTDQVYLQDITLDVLELQWGWYSSSHCLFVEVGLSWWWNV
jgi:hypothetical protein